MSNGGMPLRLVVPSLMRQSVTPVEFEVRVCFPIIVILYYYT